MDPLPSLLSLLLLFLAFPLFPSSASSQQLEPVLDTEGNSLLTGTKYYVVSVIRGGGGGGVTIGPPLTGICPKAVVQENIDIWYGFPVTFYPAREGGDSIVRISTDLNVDFSRSIPTCREFGVWKLAPLDEETGQRFVTTGGQLGNPGPETVSNWFKIEKVSNGDNYYYKLVFCPTVCSDCKVVCGDVGRYFDDNNMRRLALSDVPFGVKFLKAPIETEAAMK
ncbi:hypothetical protein SAY86_025322 [Trapa natans]|uniref:Uncharacterized protein n=1 Tax=Trapa natans TaxID=22666 RepID=A0AAN7MIT1_TRANT|nr:hypothetical protein SAY86_025322 [Trapa natans]